MEIFISYRRADSGKVTGRIYEKLVARFGAKGVFRDVNDILAARDFPSALESITRNCSVMLVIIGNEWSRILQEHVASAEDWVRLEVETGLTRKDILVLPVLVDGAAMPAASGLPPSLKALPRRNGMRLSSGDCFDRDVEALIETINETGYKRVHGTVSAGFSLYADTNRDARILTRVSRGAEVILLEYNRDGTWAHLLDKNNVDGWASMEDFSLDCGAPAQTLKEISVGKGFGAKGNTWQLYFTAPTGERTSDGQLGIDVRLADAITRSKVSLDIAAFEFDNRVLTEAVLDAKDRGLQVRLVTDEALGLKGKSSTLLQLVHAGIPVVARKSVGALMHNKFMILDGKTVWTGSWNYTEGSTYRNNENTLVFDAPEIADLYRVKFEEMFTGKTFGRKAANNDIHRIEVGGTLIEVGFTPNRKIEAHLAHLISTARRSVHFMMFLFANEALGDAIVACHARGVPVQGILEKKMSKAGRFNQLGKLQKTGVEVRFDDNVFFLHHKTIIIDESIVNTGSMNFTRNALEVNDENIIIVYDAILARVYLEEFNRNWITSLRSARADG